MKLLKEAARIVYHGYHSNEIPFNTKELLIYEIEDLNKEVSRFNFDYVSFQVDHIRQLRSRYSLEEIVSNEDFEEILFITKVYHEHFLESEKKHLRMLLKRFMEDRGSTQDTYFEYLNLKILDLLTQGPLWDYDSFEKFNSEFNALDSFLDDYERDVCRNKLESFDSIIRHQSCPIFTDFFHFLKSMIRPYGNYLSSFDELLQDWDLGFPQGDIILQTGGSSIIRAVSKDRIISKLNSGIFSNEKTKALSRSYLEVHNKIGPSLLEKWFGPEKVIQIFELGNYLYRISGDWHFIYLPAHTIV